MTVNIDLPNEVYDQAAAIARSQHIDVADVLAAACAEHVGAWERLEQRAKRADRVKFLEVLAKVPDVEPDAADHLTDPTA
jgi:predicted nucleic acid-binding protein